MDKWLLMDTQRQWFLEMESTSDEDVLKIIEMGKKSLDYSINLIDKAKAGLRELTPVLKDVQLWVKCYQTALHTTEKLPMKGRVNRCG